VKAALGLGLTWAVLALAGAPMPAMAAELPKDPLEVDVDADDDDGDGVADGAAPRVAGVAARDLVPLPTYAIGRTVELVGGGLRAVLPDGRPVTTPLVAPRGTAIQAVASPRDSASLVVDGKTRVPVVVRAYGFEDRAEVTTAPATSFLGFSRALPDLPPSEDPDAFRITALGPEPGPVDVLSVDAKGALLGRIDGVPLDAECGKARPGCHASRLLRVVVDGVDGSHPSSLGRSLVGRVGGFVVVLRGRRKVASVRVVGPRGVVTEPYRLRVKGTVLRAEKTGKPALFGNEVDAVAEARADLTDAAALFSQCGVAVDVADADVRVASPPPPSLVSFGNDLGLPASGGEVRALVDGKHVAAPIAPGATPLEAAMVFAKYLELNGFVAEVTRNARIAPGAMGSVDVRVLRRGGVPARVSTEGPMTTDRTLAVALGVVELSDGLTHFGDMDSPSGTLEERSLVKSLEPVTRGAHVVYVPYFAGGGRIGESFIYGDGSSVRNVVIVDRSGARARQSSHAVAHELGHVLLDMPGHPDDFGKDTPHLLMDSDASDASAYGPRRLTNDECARIVRESGPRSKAPILEVLPRGPVPALKLP